MFRRKTARKPRPAVRLDLCRLDSRIAPSITTINQTGANAAAIQPAIDAFRTTLGGANNGVGGTFADGRREINWDGVPDSFSSPNALPGNFFNSNSKRGAEFSFPSGSAGTDFRVSADASNPTTTPVRFGEINATYTSNFTAFSAERLFTPLGDNNMLVTFFIPGTTIPATVKGFAAVFNDVDQGGTTGMQFFDRDGKSLIAFAGSTANNGFSFIGGFENTGTASIAKVLIFAGGKALSGNDATGNDVVVMDDFIYGEPQATVFDFGDAPDTYGTTLASNGARHIPAGLFLGTSRNAEADGTPTADATGEPGDDGVVLSPLLTGSKATATFTVTNPSGSSGAFVSAFFDWNRDGDFNDAGELALQNATSFPGQKNTFDITVPADAVPGPTFARFRLHGTSRSAADLVPTGLYPDGEVEDYAVTVVAPDTTPPAVTVEQAIGQADPSGTAVRFALTFSEPVTGIDNSDFSFAGTTAPGKLTASLGGAAPNFTVTVTGMTGPGDVVLSFIAGGVQDAAGNKNTASTSKDNRITFTGPTLRSAAGADAAAIQATVDAFRADLGTLNPNTAGSAGTGRREINWDGVPDSLAAPNNLPADFFNVNSPRGVVFGFEAGSKGTGFQVSGKSGVAPIEFDNLNPTYSGVFQTFSAQRLFTPLGDNDYAINFFVPGTTVPATVAGFGAVFTDVDFNVINFTTSAEFFDAAGTSLAKHNVLIADDGLSFFGLSFADGRRIAKVVLITGNTPVGPDDKDGNADIVVLDDFIYGEPVAINAPPTATAPANVSGTGPFGPLTFTVADTETAAAALTVTGKSSNTALLPDTGIVFGGTGANRTVTLSPVAGVLGTATVTITVTDGGGATGTATFTVTVANSDPTVTAIADLSTAVATPTAALPFTVGDIETAADSLGLAATSSNTALVASENIVFGGTGTARTITVTPKPGQAGTATITLTITDALGATATTSFLLTVTNALPTITAITNRSTTVGVAAGPVPFTVGDGTETPAAALTVTATSSNTALVPAANILLGGTGANRTVTVTPAANQAGTAVITLTVTDSVGATAATTFTLAVTNTLPTITALGNTATTAGVAVGPLPFTVGDGVETPAAALVITAASSNTTLVPAANIVLAGSGANRTVTVTPAPGQLGAATVTLTVTDTLGGAAGTAFTLTVTATPTRTDPGLVGFRQFAVGADRGGATTTAFFNPDGTPRFSTEAFAAAGGVRTAAADFNGDGVADVVVGTGPGVSTRVRILDGVTKAELFAVDAFEAGFTGGVFVTAGDLNGDGVADLVITPDEGGGPRVDVYSGKGFGKFASFFGIDDPNFRGGARAATGDVSGDGRADLIVVAGFGGGPRVAGFDGTTVGGTPARIFGDFFAFEQGLRNGIFVAVGDVDGDGFADLIAGGGPGGGPRVTVFGGKPLTANTYEVKANFFGGDDTSRGGIRVAAKDLDGDTQADIVVGAGTAAGSRVTGYFGKNLLPAGTPTEAFAFDAFPGFSGGVFVG